MKLFAISSLVLAVLVLASAGAGRADTIQLDNGDTMHGKVVSMDDEQVKFKSEIHGELSLARGRVVAVVLGDRGRGAKVGKSRPKASPMAPRAVGDEPPGPEAGDGTEKADATQKAEGGEEEERTETPAEIIKRLAPADFGTEAVDDLEENFGKPAFGGPNGDEEPTPDDIVRQLRTDGIDPGLMNELQLKLPGFTSPEVQTYFNDRVGGLVSGAISIQDIRKDAVGARDQLLDLKKDLGPDAAALDGYLSILEGFIRQTAPPDEGQSPMPTTPPMKEMP